MHKKSIELAKKCMDEMCMIGEPTAEQWQNFYYCMKGCAAGVCAEKDYKSIEAMEDAKKEQEALKLIGAVPPAKVGYNGRRYSNGQYAPVGRGHVSGFYPYYNMEDDDFINGYVNDPNFAHNMKMGYPVGTQSTGAMNTQHYSYGNMPGYFNDGMDIPKHGRSYNDYREAKRHYTETKDPIHKNKMREKAEDVFNELEEITMNIMEDMTPEERVKYREKLQRTVNKM